MTNQKYKEAQTFARQMFEVGLATLKKLNPHGNFFSWESLPGHNREAQIAIAKYILKNFRRIKRESKRGENSFKKNTVAKQNI